MNSFWTYKYNVSDNSDLINTIANGRDIDVSVPLVFHSPELLPDFKAAKDIIISAIENSSTILIYGDYDADGITATTILHKFLSYFSPYVNAYIPDRFIDGYGMSVKKIQQIIEHRTADLVITVDNGITALEPIKLLKENGIKVIVTDHHTCLDELPAADAIVNCHRKDSTYPFSDLCGAGVAFKLAQGINNELEHKYPEMSELLDLAALGTIADVVPLLDENKAIVVNSLQSICDSRSHGIKAMITCSESLRTKKTISSEDVAFSIAPMINAASRMDRIDAALSLLYSVDSERAMVLAKLLIDINDDRKAAELQVTSDAMGLINRDNLYSQFAPLVVVKENWNKGVTGITAAKLAEKFQCPVFIGTIEDGIISGSARSYGNYNIIEALSAVSNSLISFGGHPGAGGFKLNLSDLEDFKTNLFVYSYDHPWSFETYKQADALIPIKGINIDLVSSLDSLGPFGEANNTPVFLSKGLVVGSIVAIGKDKNTLKMTVKNSDGDALNCIGFSMASFVDCLRPGDMVNIAYKLSINYFAGRSSVQAMLVDIESAPILNLNETLSGNWDNIYNVYQLIKNGEYDKCELCHEDIPSDFDYKTCFPVIISIAERLMQKNNGISLGLLTLAMSSVVHQDVSPVKVLLILETINETNFMNVIVSYNMDIYFVSSSNEKTRITLTPLYNYIKNNRSDKEE